MGLFGGRRSSRRRRVVTVPTYSPARGRSKPRPLSPGTKRIIRWIIGGVIAYLFVAGPRGAFNLLSLWRTENALERRELRLSAEIVELETQRNRLETDTLYIERIARTEYRMARPDEVIYELDEAAP